MLEAQTIPRTLTARLVCPSCGGRPSWDGPEGRCGGCGRRAVVRGEHIVDFLDAPAGPWNAVLGWSDDFVRDVLPGLAAWPRAEDAARGDGLDPWEAAGLVEPHAAGPRLTALGRTIAYHLAEHRCQAAGDGIESFRTSTALGERSRVLDLGCGAGQTLRLLDASRPEERTGLDVDLEALCLGSRLTGPGQAACRFLHAGADAIPFADDSFSHVICRVALNYMPQGPALAEIVRVLQPGGHLYCRAEGIGFDLRLLMHGRSARQFLGRIRNLLWGLSLESIGWRPRWGERLAGERTFVSGRRLGRILRPRCSLDQARVTGRYLGFPLGVELVASKR